MNELLYFYEFFIKSFKTLNAQYCFMPNWYTHLLLSILHAIANQNLKRVVINIPPRYLKSIAISVILPAWVIGNDLTKRIIACSYSQKLSNKLSQDCKLLLSEPWVKQVFHYNNITKTQNQIAKFITEKGGFRMATSTFGTLIGEGGDILIVDDPHNTTHINSYDVRNKTIEWFQNTLMTRLNNKAKGSVVVVMQRLHKDDLSGHIIEKDQYNTWTHISLPAINETLDTYMFANVTVDRQSGTALHNRRENKKILDRIKFDMGIHAFTTQYLQSPHLTQDNTLIKEEWFQLCDQPPFTPDLIIQSWDTAINTNKHNDFTACTTWGISNQHGIILLEAIRYKLEFPALKQTLLKSQKEWQSNIVLIEGKASGSALAQDLQGRDFAVLVTHPKQDKYTRLSLNSGILTIGKTWVTKKAWRSDIKAEILNFPNTKHDDIIDTISQFLSFLRENKYFHMEFAKTD